MRRGDRRMLFHARVLHPVAIGAGLEDGVLDDLGTAVHGLERVRREADVARHALELERQHHVLGLHDLVVHTAEGVPIRHSCAWT